RFHIGQLPDSDLLLECWVDDSLIAAEIGQLRLHVNQRVAVLLRLLVKEFELAGRTVDGQVLLEVQAGQRVQHASRQLRIFRAVFHTDQIRKLDGLYRKVLFQFDDGARGLLVDRKSTRLNSSHRTTSYAVFCLKKKNV